MFTPQQKVIHKGRPAVVITTPEVGRTGATLYGIRYTDVEQWEPAPGFPQYLKPTRGSVKIAREDELTIA